MMTGRRALLVTRLSIAVLLAASATIGATSLSSAAPSREEVQQARARLDSLNRELGLMVEQYNQARLKLQEVQARLADVRDQAHRAQATADRAISSLNANAARAYRGVGSQIAELFESASMADFSDRLEFIGSMAQADSDLAVEAESAQQEARWTAAELKATAEERLGIVDALAAKQDQIESRVAEARDLYEELDRQYHEALAAQAAAQEAATSSSVGVSPIPPPPAPNANVAAVLQAAYSMIGTPYQYGGSSPEAGFDCSGFTMWAWSHAGVYLPHSSAAQYASLLQVAQSDLQPGDLVFFYSPISHVGMYVGGGSMIHSPNTGSVVSVVPIYWDSFVGAARPG
ncbi:MAG TPA: NlpC/P60 family protein [Actinomycetota bacterium]|nr:NlpC/P60 family protein [Actinomycetota bacterium]